MTHQNHLPAASTSAIRVLGAPDDIAEDMDVSRISRFQSLEPGTYWRFTGGDLALDPGKDGGAPTHPGSRSLFVGLMLLLVDIELFDGTPHTVVLRSHPRESHVSTRKFLVHDFLNIFCYEPDGEAVRSRELAELQQEIVAAQTDLMNDQINPQALTPLLTARLEAWEKEHDSKVARELDRKAAAQSASAGPEAAFSPMPIVGTSLQEQHDQSESKAVALLQSGGRISTSLGGALDARLSSADVRALVKTVERQSVIAETQAKWLEGKVRCISEKVSQMAPFFAEKSAVALARTKGIQDYAAELMKGIRTLSLYTGEGVEVATLCEGQGAADDEPLTLMQSKLYMEEEFAAHADVGESFDFSNISEFEACLASDASLRDRIFPHARCVVSMAVRRRDLDYPNAT